MGNSDLSIWMKISTILAAATIMNSKTWTSGCEKSLLPSGKVIFSLTDPKQEVRPSKLFGDIDMYRHIPSTINLTIATAIEFFPMEAEIMKSVFFAIPDDPFIIEDFAANPPPTVDPLGPIIVSESVERKTDIIIKLLNELGLSSYTNYIITRLS